MENKTHCMDCGQHRDNMDEVPWGRYIKNSEGKYEDFIQCKRCREKEVLAKIDAFKNKDIDTKYEANVICPYCGTEHYADGDNEDFYTDGDHEFECHYCQNEFSLTTDVSYHYSTYIK